MKTSQYYYLIGKTKEEVLNELGDQFNYYPSDVWTVFIKRDWLGRKIFLYIYFSNEIVVKIEFKN